LADVFELVACFTNNICPFKALKSKSCQGGFELITLETEPHVSGFLNPCRQAIVNHSRAVRHLNILTLASFRASPNDPAPLMNPPKNGSTKTFPFQGIVRLVDESNHESRKQPLKVLAALSNDYHREHPPRQFNGTQQQWADTCAKQPPKYIVADDYDRTPPRLRHLHKLDHYLTPKAVVQIISNAYSHIDHTWAERNPELAEQYGTNSSYKIHRWNFVLLLRFASSESRKTMNEKMECECRRHHSLLSSHRTVST
jgi:hypothetical protein